ncbi:hypothetical protein B0H13DRAFT_1905644 [Mycena leptocephala]|nr:hypothetical protein B0H13DRAFT_1905644 [Mycena leptocephala]
MQTHPIVLAVALSFASLVAGQFDAVGTGEAATPSSSGMAPTFYSTAAGAVATSYASSGEAVPYGGGVSKGMVIGAAVGGSVAASLVILAGGLFCLRYRARKMKFIAVESAHNTDLGTRCDQLEREVREQLDRLEAQRLAGHYGGGAVLYTHEKDSEVFFRGAEKKEGKEGPPTYAD